MPRKTNISYPWHAHVSVGIREYMLIFRDILRTY